MRLFQGEYPEEAPFTISELEEIHPTASAKAKEKTEAGEAFWREGSGGQPLSFRTATSHRAIWNHIMNVSLADLKKNYDNLKVYFDLWKGESDAQPYIPGLINDLIEKRSCL